MEKQTMELILNGILVLLTGRKFCKTENGIKYSNRKGNYLETKQNGKILKLKTATSSKLRF